MTPETKGSDDKRIEWLDEQRRKDSEVLSRLNERVASIESTLGTQGKQMQDLASELTKVSAQASRVSRFDESLDKHRKNISQQLATAQKRQLDRQRDLEGLWKADQKQVAQSMDELRREFSTLEEVRQGLITRQEEATRLRKDQDAIDARVERLLEQSRDQARAMAAMEEAREQDSKRAIKLQAGQAEQRKTLDAMAVRADQLEDSYRRLERQGSEIESAQDELREAHRLWSEQQAAQLAEFGRGWKQWQRQFQDFSTRADQLNERMLAYEETYRSLLQLRGELEGVIQRLERRITEVGELQRLAEDRLKQEWTAFKADDQKRWSGLQLAEDERWKDHERRHERIDARLEEQHSTLTALVHDLTEMIEINRRRAMDALALLREWVEEIAAPAEEVK